MTRLVTGVCVCLSVSVLEPVTRLVTTLDCALLMSYLCHFQRK